MRRMRMPLGERGKMNEEMVCRSETRKLPFSPSLTLLHHGCIHTTHLLSQTYSCIAWDAPASDTHKVYSLTSLRYPYTCKLVQEIFPDRLSQYVSCLTFNHIPATLLSLYPPLLFFMNLLLPDIIYLLFTVFPLCKLRLCFLMA